MTHVASLQKISITCDRYHSTKFHEKVPRMSCGFKAEVSKMAVLYQNCFIVSVAKMILLAIVGINKSIKLPSFTMWDNSVQDSYKEFNPLTVDDA